MYEGLSRTGGVKYLICWDGSHEYWLTARMHAVLCLMAKGLTQDNIAERLFVSRRTVDTLTHRMYRELHVHHGRQCLEKARALGFIQDVNFEGVLYLRPKAKTRS